MQFWLKKKMPKMISKKVYISRGGVVKANLEKVYILNFFLMTASLMIDNNLQ